MPRYLSLGSIPKKRHTAHRTEGGYKGEGIFYEEVVSTHGFSRAYSIVYHRRPPTRVKRVQPAGTNRIERAEQPALPHHHLKSGKMSAEGDPITRRVPLLTQPRHHNLGAAPPPENPPPRNLLSPMAPPPK